MKEPFTLYSSGIALARFAADRADITHSSRDIFGLDFSEPQPMTCLLYTSVDEVDDQLHLVDTFKVCHFRLISRFYESIKTCLHQLAYSSAANCLFCLLYTSYQRLTSRIQESAQNEGNCRDEKTYKHC